jgi:hypothetical protein
LPASPATHGYSGRTLAQKLGVKAGVSAIVLHAPAHYDALFDGDAPQRAAKARAADLIHLFCKDRAAFQRALAPAFAHLNAGGAIWVSWPKKTSPLFRDMTEQDIRDHALPMGLVDVKVCAVDADWSGLKLMRRRAT